MPFEMLRPPGLPCLYQAHALRDHKLVTRGGRPTHVCAARAFARSGQPHVQQLSTGFAAASTAARR